MLHHGLTRHQLQKGPDGVLGVRDPVPQDAHGFGQSLGVCVPDVGVPDFRTITDAAERLVSDRDILLRLDQPGHDAEYGGRECDAAHPSLFHSLAPLKSPNGWLARDASVSMWRALILDSSVWRGMRSFAAAAEGPEIRPRDSASAAMIKALSPAASVVILLFDGADPLSGLLGVALDQIFGQDRNVDHAFAQRRDPDGKDIEAIEEVWAERATRYGALEIAVRGGEDTHIDGNRMTAPQPFDLPFLEHAQQGDLGLGGELPDFVQEDRAAVCGLEPPESPLERAGERSLFVAEQLGGDERRRNGRAVHPDERAARASGPLVNGAGDQLLAGPSLTEDEHGGIGRGHLRHLRQHALQGGG